MRYQPAFTGTLTLALVSTMLARVPVAAEPIYWARASVTANTPAVSASEDFQFLSDDTGQVTGSDTAGPVSITATNSLGETATGIASVLDGALHAYASSDGGKGSALSSFLDTFTLTSATLPAGTLVDLLIDLEVSYSLVGGSSCSSLDDARVTASVADNAGTIEAFRDSTCDDFDFEIDRIAQHRIGEEFFLVMDLFSIAGFDGPALADAGNTLRLVVTPVGDFTFTTASGNTYQATDVTSVPEPATLTLLGTSLIGLAAARRRRSASSSSARARASRSPVVSGGSVACGGSGTGTS